MGQCNKNNLYLAVIVVSLIVIFVSFAIKYGEKSWIIDDDCVLVELADKSDIDLSTDEGEPLVINYGSLETNKLYKFHFTLKNSNYYPIIIGDVRTNCNCTGHVVSKKILDANDTTLLKVFFNTREKAGNQIIVLNIILNQNYQQQLLLKGKVH